MCFIVLIKMTCHEISTELVTTIYGDQSEQFQSSVPNELLRMFGLDLCHILTYTGGNRTTSCKLHETPFLACGFGKLFENCRQDCIGILNCLHRSDLPLELTSPLTCHIGTGQISLWNFTHLAIQEFAGMLNSCCLIFVQLQLTCTSDPYQGVQHTTLIFFNKIPLF